jgi:peptidoglycan/xylan/chitin deacetylase (PgdA/CDA1 family)
MWTCDSLGWNGATIEQIVDRCGSTAEAGDIILMHVGANALDGEALPALIETLQAQGFDLVTVEQLLQP